MPRYAANYRMRSLIACSTHPAIPAKRWHSPSGYCNPIDAARAASNNKENAMAFLENQEIRLHYQVEGREDAPWLVLSNSLGTGMDMWSPQAPALLEHFRLLRYDTRGHGKSSAPPGAYRIAQLGDDVIFLMDHLN